MYVMRGQILYWLRCLFYFRKPIFIIIFNLTSLQWLQQHISVLKMATVLFPCDVRLRDHCSLEFQALPGNSANYFIWDQCDKNWFVEESALFVPKLQVVHDVKHFLDREEICCGWLRFYFFSQVFQQFKMTLLKLEMSQRNSFWVRNELLRWTLVVQLIFPPRKVNFEEFC